MQRALLVYLLPTGKTARRRKSDRWKRAPLTRTSADTAAFLAMGTGYPLKPTVDCQQHAVKTVHVHVPLRESTAWVSQLASAWKRRDER